MKRKEVTSLKSHEYVYIYLYISAPEPLKKTEKLTTFMEIMDKKSSHNSNKS